MTWSYRSQPPVTLTSGHYAAVYNDELWVFPGARNRESQRAFRLNLTTFTWSDRWMHGDVPTRNFNRRNVEALLDGNRLILLGKDVVGVSDVGALGMDNQRCS